MSERSFSVSTAKSSTSTSKSTSTSTSKSNGIRPKQKKGEIVSKNVTGIILRLFPAKESKGYHGVIKLDRFQGTVNFDSYMVPKGQGYPVRGMPVTLDLEEFKDTFGTNIRPKNIRLQPRGKLYECIVKDVEGVCRKWDEAGYGFISCFVPRKIINVTNKAQIEEARKKLETQMKKAKKMGLDIGNSNFYELKNLKPNEEIEKEFYVHHVSTKYGTLNVGSKVTCDIAKNKGTGNFEAINVQDYFNGFIEYIDYGREFGKIRLNNGREIAFFFDGINESVERDLYIDDEVTFQIKEQRNGKQKAFDVWLCQNNQYQEYEEEEVEEKATVRVEPTQTPEKSDVEKKTPQKQTKAAKKASKKPVNKETDETKTGHKKGKESKDTKKKVSQNAKEIQEPQKAPSKGKKNKKKKKQKRKQTEKAIELPVVYEGRCVGQGRIKMEDGTGVVYFQQEWNGYEVQKGDKVQFEIETERISPVRYVKNISQVRFTGICRKYIHKGEYEDDFGFIRPEQRNMQDVIVYEDQIIVEDKDRYKEHLNLENKHVEFGLRMMGSGKYKAVDVKVVKRIYGKTKPKKTYSKQKMFEMREKLFKEQAEGLKKLERGKKSNAKTQTINRNHKLKYVNECSVRIIPPPTINFQEIEAAQKEETRKIVEKEKKEDKERKIRELQKELQQLQNELYQANAYPKAS